MNSKIDLHHDKIVVLDYGSQYTQLIARRIRESGVYCEIHPYDIFEHEIKQLNAKGIILSGGPESTTQEEAPKVSQSIFELNIPILGICYGMQAITSMYGGQVETSEHREYGYAQVRARGHSALLTDIEDHTTAEGFGLLDVWMSHGDRVTKLPDNFIVIASTDNAPIAGIANENKKLYGLQFHPEVTHTTQGSRILDRFVKEICQCQALWSLDNIIDDNIQKVQQLVGSDQVLLGLSGGVDSSVVAAMLHKAIGDQLICVFVDNGLLRLNEGDQVMATFDRHMGVKVIRVDAENRFLDALKNVVDPEKKRKVIGNLFIEIFEEEAAKLENIKWLAQGTIYPDVIESAGSKTGKAKVIKSHHNVGGLPERMKMSLVEPLRELFKDEVRRLGVELGLPSEMIYRHPFPGPGLGVRILGEIKKEYADILRLADAIFIEELYKHNLYDKVSQAFAVFIPVKSVGVVGDNRQYDFVVSLRAVETIDFMTAKAAHLPYELLDKLSTRIINEVSGISRVVYDISGKPPATIEWE
ncbi:MAG: glutamine-hydrolyzing GMP synthase [Methylococcales bacterium]|nr:glutamine-hydrolyzing GMP synthase [Methylococcales bacterium]